MSEMHQTSIGMELETFQNNDRDNDFSVEITCPEFTAVCPKTGQPDFAEFTITYTPEEKCLELKALKLYFVAFRDVGEFHEHVTNRILNDLVKACNPTHMVVKGKFNVRGGIYTTVVAQHHKNN